MVESKEYGKEFSAAELKVVYGLFRHAIGRFKIEGDYPKINSVDEISNENIDDVLNLAEQVGFDPMGGRIDRIMEEKVLEVKTDEPRVFTSYWGNLGTLERFDVFPVSVARFAPRGIKGERYGKLIALAPTPEMLKGVKSGKMDAKGFDEAYDRILSDSNPHELYEEALKLGGGLDVALMCYEHPSDRCHRFQASTWLNDQLELTGDKQVVEFAYKS